MREFPNLCGSAPQVVGLKMAGSMLSLDCSSTFALITSS